MLGALFLFLTNSSLGIVLAGSKLVIKEKGLMISLKLTLEIKIQVLYKPLIIEEVTLQL